VRPGGHPGERNLHGGEKGRRTHPDGKMNKGKNGRPHPDGRMNKSQGGDSHRDDRK
jgi:hypothetical protein